MKAVRLSALRIGRFNPPQNIPGTHFCYRLSRPQAHSTAGRIILMKNSTDTTGNRIPDRPACSAVPQPPAQPRAPGHKIYETPGGSPALRCGYLAVVK